MWVGWFFVVLGVVGYFVGDLWTPLWTFTMGESVAYLAVGVVVLAGVYWGKTKALFDLLLIAVGMLALFFAGYGWFIEESNFRNLANLELVDNIVHTVVGLWAFWIVWKKGRR